MNNPMEDEPFNKLFHVTVNLVRLVKKLDRDKTQRGYIEQMEELIDQIYLSKNKGE